MPAQAIEDVPAQMPQWHLIVPAQAANVEFEDVPAQMPQWHQHVEDLHENRVPELERQMTDLRREVEELRQAFNQLMHALVQGNAVDVMHDLQSSRDS